MTPVGRRGVDAGLLLLRLGSGLSLFFFFSIAKIQDAMRFFHTGQWSFVEFNRRIGLPAPVAIAVVQTVNESLVALLVAGGVFGRLSAASLTLGFTAASLCSLAAGESWLPAAAYWLMFTTLLLTGPGDFSIDAWRRSRGSKGPSGGQR